MVEIPQDFKELLRLFCSHKVACLVVGGYALSFHGAPRFTGDLDLWVENSPENAGNILRALLEFGFGSLALKPDDLTRPGQIIQLGFPPVRVDLITSITGVSWQDAWAGKISGQLADLPVFFLGYREFIANKKAAGRRKDLADLETLGETCDPD